MPEFNLTGDEEITAEAVELLRKLLIEPADNGRRREAIVVFAETLDHHGRPLKTERISFQRIDIQPQARSMPHADNSGHIVILPLAGTPLRIRTHPLKLRRGGGMPETHMSSIRHWEGILSIVTPNRCHSDRPGVNYEKWSIILDPPTTKEE